MSINVAEVKGGKVVQRTDDWRFITQDRLRFKQGRARRRNEWFSFLQRNDRIDYNFAAELTFENLNHPCLSLVRYRDYHEVSFFHRLLIRSPGEFTGSHLRFE